MRAFITGATGFAGSHLAEHLLDCGDRVFGCGLRASWSHDAPKRLHRRVPLVGWDLAGKPPAEVRSRLEEFAPDCIYHLAAIAAPADCGDKQPTEQALRVNVEGAQAVLDLAAALPTRPRVLLVSSSSVYAPRDAANLLTAEDAPLQPTSAYGQTKLAAEERARRAVEQGRLEVVIARAFNHSGPRQAPRFMLPEWARQFARGDDPVRVFSLHSTLDLSDVRDVVRGYRLLAEGGSSGEAYNLGSGVARTSEEIFHQLRQMADPNRRWREVDSRERRHGIADLTKTTAAVGWRPRIPLEKTLADTLAYYVAQETR